MTSRKSMKHDDEIDLVAFLQVLWERKSMILLITIIFGIAAVVFALTATPIYRAKALVGQVDDASTSGVSSLASQFGNLAGLAGMNLRVGSSRRDHLAILKSRYLVEEFINRNDLLKQMSPGGGEPLTLWLAVKQFRENILSVREDDETGLTTIEVSWTDPVIAAEWANSLVGLANEIIRVRALQEAESNIEYLNQQIEDTNVVELQRIMYRLVENETKTLMLANARSDYAFVVVDPAIAPEIRFSPKRKLIVLSGVVIGFAFAVIVVLANNLIRRVRAELERNDVDVASN